MDLTFENPNHERLVNDHVALSKKFDKHVEGAADDIIDAMHVLVAAPSLAEVPRAYRPHPLKAAMKGHFAINVNKTHRVVFKPDHSGDPHFRIDNYKTITAIVVVEIFTDYH